MITPLSLNGFGMTTENDVVPTLPVGEIIKGVDFLKTPFCYEVKGILKKSFDEIIYDAIIKDSSTCTRIEIVEIVRDGGYANSSFDRVSFVYGEKGGGTYPVYIEHKGKTYFVRTKYEVCKLKVGDHIHLHGADYEVVQSLGRGSYGEILKLQCGSRTFRNKIQKILHPSKKYSDELVVKQFRRSTSNTSKDFHYTILMDEPELTAKVHFKRGYDAMSRLTHPNIVEVYDYFVKGDIPCFTMEYIEGCNLRQYVERNGCLSEHDAQAIIKVICKTLLYCHEYGVTHGDLKPNNVMIIQNKTVRIIDFEGVGRSDHIGIAVIYVYLLTGVYMDIKGLATQTDLERITTMLDKKGVGDVTKSHIIFLLLDNWSAKPLSNRDEAFMTILNAIENDEILDNHYMPTHGNEVIWGKSHALNHSSEARFNCFYVEQSETSDAVLLSSDFTEFKQDGLYGLKNKDGKIVIPPIYTFITPVGCYHVPGSGPSSGWNIVGVMTFRNELTGWYEIVDNKKMKLVMECNTSVIRSRQMMT